MTVVCSQIVKAKVVRILHTLSFEQCKRTIDFSNSTNVTVRVSDLFISLNATDFNLHTGDVRC